MFRRALPWLLLAVAACGDSTGPPPLEYPELSAQMVAAWCVRGNATVGQVVAGSISASDCDLGDIDESVEGYYEIYQVKVRTSRRVTFTVSSNFDSYLSLARLFDYTDTSLDLGLLLEDDDSASGIDAELSYDLVPDRDYFIVVSGFDYTETGTYTLRIQ